MILDVEELLKVFNCFFEQVEIVAMPAEQQIKTIKIGVVADEIALDFCEMGMLCAKQLYESDWITSEQYLLAKELDEKFDEMSDNKHLWDEEALMLAHEWEDCRQIARKLLSEIS